MPKHESEAPQQDTWSARMCEFSESVRTTAVVLDVNDVTGDPFVRGAGWGRDLVQPPAGARETSGSITRGH